jgi:hypothetical protein
MLVCDGCYSELEPGRLLLETAAGVQLLVFGETAHSKSQITAKLQ